MIQVKRIYDEPEAAKRDDGYRILVDRLWPRGLSKERAKVDLWMKEIAPSDQLRRWFSHDPQKWDEFQKRYARELSGKKEALDRIREIEREKGRVTLLFSSKEERHNNAIALRDALRSQG